MLLAAGSIEASELDSHPDKNIITQCIGWQELDEVTVDTIEGVWQKNQWIVLCSDGLSDEVDDAEIAQLLNGAKKTQDAVELLIDAALESGGHDNITIQVIESPLTKRHISPKLTEWIPKISTQTGVNTVFYSAVAIGLSLISYWLLT
jgi:serine/threonine protein phosphatase PrpC